MPILHRRNDVLATAAAGRLTVVVMKPAELPLHAWRPPIGLEKAVLIVALYTTSHKSFRLPR